MSKMMRALALCMMCLPCCAEAMVMPSAASMTRRAIDLSNRANVDPSFAEEACKLWSSILDTNGTTKEQMPLPLGAMPAAHALHASTLVRIGRDKEAIIEYQKSLEYLREGGASSKPLTKEEADIRMGFGKSLQRMLRYPEAADMFLDVAARCMAINTNVARQDKGTPEWVRLVHSDSVLRAALCSMRAGDVESAISVLEKFEGQDAEVNCMHGALLLMQIQANDSNITDAKRKKISQRAKELLDGASDKSLSPLYRWIELTSYMNSRDGKEIDRLLHQIEGDVYLSFAKVNNSPFDDPALINLDDKILLHSAVMDSFIDGNEFWPRGYILPEEYDLFVQDCKKYVDNEKRKTWILKERSGYGSRGNKIMSTDEVKSVYGVSDAAGPILCQRIVDPPMLIDGRKFSLRIYVVYFSGGSILSEREKENYDAEILISNEGLAKFASASYGDDTTEGNANFVDDQYMTNSGRGDGRSSQQQDLRQLQRDFHKRDLDYKKMWERIEQSVHIVMKRYLRLQSEDSLTQNITPYPGYTFIQSQYEPFCSIPKILGFDFILDFSGNPFLLEVNRFPGLEPRSSMDAGVKQAVVYDAWAAASDRMGVSKKYIQRLQPRNYKGFSLKQVSLK